MVLQGPGKVELVFKPADGGKETHLEVFNFHEETAGGGVALSMYNTKEV